MSRENTKQAVSGWPMLCLAISLIIVAVLFFLGRNPVMVTLAVITAIAFGLTCAGFLILQPNEAAVLLLFGKYVSSVKTGGYWWVNPFYTKKKLSLRLRNLVTDKIKVNDKVGNPVEIAAVLVWKVEDTFSAMFEVDNYAQYVAVQSEAAIRHLATAYPYDSWEAGDSGISLRGNVDDVSAALEKELLVRLAKAGVQVLEARLMHLAYAPEIAEAMLRRQQASAVVAARQKIVEGAVGMVRMALEMLKEEQVVELDEERKAAMVSNLLVVLCGESHTQPIVNAGTLY